METTKPPGAAFGRGELPVARLLLPEVPPVAKATLIVPG